jgi:hypothetical protein
MRKEEKGMRMGTATTLQLLLVAIALAGLLVSCDDTSEPDYSTLMGGGQTQTSGTPDPDSTPSQAPGQTATPADAPVPGEEEVPEELVPAVVVTLEDTWANSDGLEIPQLVVEPPYYECVEAGRYDITVAVVVEENIPAQVYRIVAIGADGEEVGSQERHLQLPMKKPRTFDLNNFYCTSIPVAIEFYELEKDPAVAEGMDDAGAGGGRGGAGSGGSGAPPQRGGAGMAGDDEDEDT